jgi:hypothetical protein
MEIIMKLGLMATITSVFTLAVGLTIGFAASAGTTEATLDAATAPASGASVAAVTSGATAPKYVLLDCPFKGVTEPSSYILACADDGLGLESLHWTTWTSHFAGAYGTLYENDCQPSCADGHFHTYSVLVTAWGSRGVKGNPSERAYTELTLTFPGTSRPPVYQLVNGKVVATYPVTQVVEAA